MSAPTATGIPGAVDGAALAINLGVLVVAGTGTLLLQRLLYRRRKRAHLRELVEEAGRVPVRSRD